MTTTATLEVGQAAPDFKLKGPGGQPVTLSEYREKKNVVIVFYPLAFTSVCAHQLPELQRSIEHIEALDATIVGISVDSHFANEAFAKQLGVTFPLLSDWHRKVSTAYGMLLPKKGYSGRGTFIVDRGGMLAYKDVSENLSDVPSLEGVLGALKALA